MVDDISVKTYNILSDKFNQSVGKMEVPGAVDNLSLRPPSLYSEGSNSPYNRSRYDGEYRKYISLRGRFRFLEV